MVKRLLWVVTVLLSLCAIAGVVYFARHWFGVPRFPPPAAAALPAALVRDGKVVVAMPNGNLLLHTGTYDNELTAWLRYEYLQSLPLLHGAPELLIAHDAGAEPTYDLYVAMPNDLLAAGQLAGELEGYGFIRPGSFFLSPPRSQIDDWQQQTGIFQTAYSGPVRKNLLKKPRAQLTSDVARFILFKSRTDRRVRHRMEIVADQDISLAHSMQFAADMIDVARFYDLPLDMLLGMGAMENNYLDIRGDLQHASWKRHVQKGDIVLRHGKRGVLVSNYASGPWQITRETLRYAHQLFLADRKRNYSELPERLRPPHNLDLQHVTTAQLTTYAALLMRNLLDYFHGDVSKAVGAYNGGPANPNLQYYEGVNNVATYAHRILSLAAGRKGNAVAEAKLQTNADSE